MHPSIEVVPKGFGPLEQVFSAGSTNNATHVFLSDEKKRVKITVSDFRLEEGLITAFPVKKRLAKIVRL